MTSLKHKFTSGKSAAADPTLVDGPNWDDEHLFGGGINDQVLTRDSVQTNGWKWGWALIRETGGPTTLTPGVIADGQVLKRSGTAIVGAQVGTSEIADNAITDPKLADNAITNPKLRDSVGTSVVGRSAGTTGDPADIQATADGQVLRRSAGALGFGAVPIGGIDGLPFQVVADGTPVNNTAVETEVYASSSIPGGTLGTTGVIELDLIGEVLNNSLANQNITMRATFGGAVLGAISFEGMGISTLRRRFWMRVVIAARGAANAQAATMLGIWDEAKGVAGQLANGPPAQRLSGHHSLAIDTTAAQTVGVTVQFGAADASLEFVRRSAALRIIKD